MSFFNELKRRNVFRVAIAYVIVAWLIAQVSALAFDSFAAPDWVIKTVLFLLVIGFPLALVFAWAFELTAEGLRRDSSGSSGQSVPGTHTKWLDRLIILVLILAIGYFGFDTFMLGSGGDDEPMDKATVLDAVDVKVSENVAPEDSAAPSIAVLPFINMSDDPGNEYFSEGLSEELLNLLARIPELHVAARTSSFSFKGKDTQIAQIADELNVDHVLEGSVRKSGNRVRITVQLIKASDGYHVFSQNYDRTLKDIFAVQDEIASSVVDALRITLLGDQPEVEVSDPEVYALYLKGRYFNNLKGRENWENATVTLRDALVIDPQFAPAWSELSTTYRYQANSALIEPTEGFELARAAAKQALALDANLASAWVSLGYVRILADWDWEGAEDATRQAQELEPRNADILNGIGQIAVTLGRFDEAIRIFEAAVALDPLSQSPLNSLGLAYLYSGDFEKAESAFRLLLKLNPQYPWGHTNLGTVMLLRGDAREALNEIRQNPQNNHRALMEVMALISLHEGNEEDAAVIEFMETIGQSAPFWAAHVYSWRGNVDEAFGSLERAIEQREPSLVYILGSPYFENLEGDPRWRALLDKIGLRDAYIAMKQREGEGGP
jgi:TolB-like protein/Flp pilus assembly protein TadD